MLYAARCKSLDLVLGRNLAMRGPTMTVPVTAAELPTLLTTGVRAKSRPSAALAKHQAVPTA